MSVNASPLFIAWCDAPTPPDFWHYPPPIGCASYSLREIFRPYPTSTPTLWYMFTNTNRSTMRLFLPLLMIICLYGTGLKAQCDATFTTQVNGAIVYVQANDSNTNVYHQWRFGDGHIAWAPSTSHTYGASGTYLITHYVFDSLNTCADSATYSVNINVPATCQASFIAHDSTLTGYYLFISTSTNSSGYINSLTWVIDGDTVSTNEYFTTYLTPGYHSVCLTISTTAGCSSTACDTLWVDSTQTDTCNINPGFAAQVSGATVQLQANDNSPYKLHLWKFGDGQQGWGANVSHTYAASGTYIIKHYITDSLTQCTDSASQTINVTVQATCTASFNAVDTIDNSYYFYSTSTSPGGSITSYTWTLNGDTVSISSWFHYYLPQGWNQVCLSITTSTGCSASVCDSIFVDSTSGCTIDASFTKNVSDATVELQGVNASNVYHHWKFGDGHQGWGAYTTHTYAASGTYTIRHYVTDSVNNCTDSSQQTITITLPPTCQASFYKKDTVQPDYYYFASTSTATGGSINSYTWTINGDTVSTYSVFASVLQPGWNYICLTITTTAGCSSTACDSVLIDGDSCDVDADFTYIVNGAQVQLQASDASPNLYHYWILGDGNQAAGPNVSHTYPAPGVYTVRHFVTDTINNCSDSVYKLITITLPDTCTASFVSFDSTGNIKVFYSTSTSPGASITSWTWTINGDTVSAAPVFDTILSPGGYQVCLTIGTNKGCTASVCDSIFVSSNDSSFRSGPAATLVTSYPNPTQSHEVKVALPLLQPAMVSITVYNAYGNVVYRQQRAFGAGDNRISIPVTGLKQGQYFIDIQYGNTRKRSVFQKM